MTHSWFLAIFGLPSTIFVKVDPILRFWPNFHEIAIFAENPPENGRKIFFSPFLLFFLKIYPYLVSFDQFLVKKLFWLRNIAKYLFPQTPQIRPILRLKILEKGEKRAKHRIFKQPPFREKCEFFDSVKSAVHEKGQILQIC